MLRFLSFYLSFCSESSKSLHIIFPVKTKLQNHSDSNHVRTSGFLRQDECETDSERGGLAFAIASRFMSRSIVAYLLVVLVLV